MGTGQADATGAELSYRFGRGQWSAADWIMVRRPDMDELGDWVQHDDYISNELPPVEPPAAGGADPKHSAVATKHDVYISMVNKKKVSGDFTVAATMEFEEKQAPSLMLASRIAADDRGRPQYEEHVEVVLFDQGINVWRHQCRDSKSVWTKVLYARFPLQKSTKYRLQVTRKGSDISVSVEGHTIGYHEDSLPPELSLGRHRNRLLDTQELVAAHGRRARRLFRP